MEDFGANLKHFRTEKGFSQEAFAGKIGVHVTNISKYERNISIPSLEIAEKMADALEMSLDELVYGQQNEKARVRIADNELLNLFIKPKIYQMTKRKRSWIYFLHFYLKLI